MNRRKKRERRKRVAEKVIQKFAMEPKASNYIKHLAEILEITKKFPLIICSRVTTPKQEKDGSLKRGTARIRKAILAGGGKIACWEDGKEIIIEEVRKGRVTRKGLEFILELAIDYGSIPVFETTDRIIRAKDFCPKTNPAAPLTIEDFEELCRVKKLYTIATVIHPDADYIEIKRIQSTYEEKKRDKVLYDKSPGWTKRRREKYLPIVLKLRAKGMSYGEIVKETGLPLPLVRSWCRKR